MTTETTETPNLWRPVSSCGAHCVPVESQAAGAVRVALRFVALVAVVLTLIPLGVLTLLVPRRVRVAYWRTASRWGFRAIGVRLEIDDRRPDHARQIRGALIVANHISFLDIIAIATVSPARFVAKHELLGTRLYQAFLGSFGVLPHKRGVLSELRPMLDRVVGIVDDGRPVAVFPEGTTWCGHASGRFRPAFFQAAIDAGVPVLPMRVTYHRGGNTLTSPGFIGNDLIGDTLGRVIRARGVRVTLTVHPPQLPAGDRRELALRCERLVLPERHRRVLPARREERVLGPAA